MFKQKLFWTVATFAMFATSCSDEVDMPASNGGMTSFSINIEDRVASRAIGDASRVDKMAWRVYNANGECLTALNKEMTTTFPAVVNLDLVKGQTYTVAFWAQDADCGAYTLNGTDGKVTVDYTKLTNNTETADAFFGATVFTVDPKSSTSQSITLKRALAQVNVGITEADLIHADTLGIKIASSQVTINNAATTLDIFNGDVEGEATVTLADAALNAGTEKLVVEGVNYNYISSGYFLVNDPSEGAVDTSAKTVDTGGDERAIATSIDFVFKPTAGDDIELGWTNVPVQRNYRTNIVGRILTSDKQVNVHLDANWTDDYEIWDGNTAEEVTEVDGVYTITNAAELAWVAQQVNDGETTFEGKTIKLANDINLCGAEWQPIGSVVSYPSVTFAGTFDGQGYTISNFKATALGDGGVASAGFFGSITGKVQNLKVDGATIVSSHYAGVICGFSSANVGMEITNCHVTNSTVTTAPELLADGAYDNGDKAGGIIGYMVSGDKVSGCTVENLTLTAYRDLGGIAGYSRGTVENCTVTTAAITVNTSHNYNNYTNAAQYDANEIIGDKDASTVENNNSFTDVTITLLIETVTWATEPYGATEANPTGTKMTHAEALANAPEGWRVPTEAEADLMLNYGKKTKTERGWTIEFNGQVIDLPFNMNDGYADHVFYWVAETTDAGPFGEYGLAIADDLSASGLEVVCMPYFGDSHNVLYVRD